jgi:hypothetical protein
MARITPIMELSWIFSLLQKKAKIGTRTTEIPVIKAVLVAVVNWVPTVCPK